MTTQPNPFTNTSNSLKGVIDAAASVIGGDPVLPDTYGTHVSDAAGEIGNLKAPYIQSDVTKILQKHFDAASKGDPQSTKLQKSFEREVSKAIGQNRSQKKWQEG